MYFRSRSQWKRWDDMEPLGNRPELLPSSKQSKYLCRWRHYSLNSLLIYLSDCWKHSDVTHYIISRLNLAVTLQLNILRLWLSTYSIQW